MDFVIKDPVALNYTRARADEVFVLRQLDGMRTLESIRDAYNRKFAPQRASVSDIHSLVYRFHSLGLVLGASDNQSVELNRRAQKQKQWKLFGSLSNLLFLRFPGWDPERFLRALYPWVGWLFDWRAVLAGLAVCCAAAIWILVNFGEFVNRLPSLATFFTAEQLFGWVFVIGGTKVLHEFGHAIACRRFGGECHEIGPMLLVFTPALYCDTSDSWMFPNKWHRIAVGVAGIYVELVLSAIAVFVWWNTQPGFLHFASLQVIVVASISTILLNGNPLLRYDGYYVLSDLIGEPNLGENSKRVASTALKHLALGMESEEEPPAPGRQLRLFTYAALSVTYKCFVLLTILFVLAQWLKPYGLQALAVILAGVSVIGMSIGPSRSFYRWIENPSNLRRIKPGRAATSLLVLAALLIAVLTIPIRNRVSAIGFVQPTDATQQYAIVPGHLEEVMVKVGQHVEKGATIMRLRDPEIALKLEKAQAEYATQEKLIESIELMQHSDASIAAQLPVARAVLDDLANRVKQTERQQKAQVIKAEASGFIQPPPARRADEKDGALPGWSGRLWSEPNRGCFVETGDTVCSIASQESWELQTELPARKITALDIADSALVSLDALPGKYLRGKVVEIADQVSESGNFLVKISLDRDERSVGLLRSGMIGRVGITAEKRTIGARFQRWLSTVLKFRA